jgi:hypothetical protein
MPRRGSSRQVVSPRVEKGSRLERDPFHCAPTPEGCGKWQGRHGPRDFRLYGRVA